jgi:4'-phosphopantetheinyl transferase
MYWTLKEAYVKARGLGLSLHLHEFAFELSQPKIRVVFGPGCPDDERGWRFESWLVEGARHAALAVLTEDDLKVDLRPDDPTNCG